MADEQKNAAQSETETAPDYRGTVSISTETDESSEGAVATAVVNEETKEGETDGQAVDEPESPLPATNVDEQIPTFSAETLADAAINGIPDNVVKMFKSEEEFRTFLSSRTPNATTQAKSADAPNPETDATQTTLYTPEPFQFTEAESEAFDDDTKQTLNRMAGHFQDQLAKAIASVKGAIDPIGGVVGQIVQDRQQTLMDQSIRQFDSALDADESLHPLVGSKRPKEGSPEWEIRSAAFGEIDRINKITGGKLPLKELARRAVLAVQAVRGGQVPTNAMNTQTPESARQKEAERRAALQDGQVLGKPSSATAKPPSNHIRGAFDEGPIEPFSGL
jgi:hypothetical protein